MQTRSGGNMQFINGFFFQNIEVPPKPHLEVIGKSVRFPFHGQLIRNGNGTQLSGTTYDEFGPACLTNVMINMFELSFTKMYHNKTDFIHYRFIRKGTIWIGYFKGKEVDEGLATCMLTRIPDQLTLPPQRIPT